MNEKLRPPLHSSLIIPRSSFFRGVLMTTQLDPAELTLLQALAARYPTADLALAEAAALRASLGLPKGVVHVVSDVHGEYKKLRHIINNASGSLRPLVEALFAERLSADELRELL